MGREHHPLQRLLDRNGGICALCGDVCALEDATRDHVIPKSLGGAMSTWNLRLAHRACNEDRKAQFPSGAFHGISEAVQRAVWEREDGKCVNCRSAKFLLFHRKQPGVRAVGPDLVRVMCVDCSQQARRRRNRKHNQSQAAARLGALETWLETCDA